MNIFAKIMVTATVSASVALTSLVTANAMPLAGVSQLPDRVEMVQWRHGGDGDGWYRGHRGYRGYRSGYRRHGNYWYPLAAFGAGALIGGAVAAPSRSEYGSRHVEWCSERYRSYDPSTDAYAPRAGVTARCVSPY